MSSALTREMLHSSPGTRRCLLGNLAIVRGALEAGVQFFACYPGTPSSEVGDTFARIAKDADVLFEYSINEKIAVEVAFAASLTGARAMCGMKHLGLNYAADPISTIPYVGVEGGLVIVSAGDPSAITSPNEQDQRHFSRFLYYPVFDPATPEDALKMTRYAFEFSEATRLPVIMRPTTRVCHCSGMVEYGPLPTQRKETGFTKNPSRYVPIPTNARRMRSELTERWRQAEQRLQTSGFFPRSGTGRRGILASGVAYAYAAQVVQDLGLEAEITLQQVGAYPIPTALLRDFLESVDSVLVVEELTPLVEEWASLCAFQNRLQLPILGKYSGHFPIEFEYSPELVEDAVRAYLKLEKREQTSVTGPELPPRPPVLCPGCPHRASFHMVNKVFGQRTVYCNDIGCYTLGYGNPLDACDVVLCMGSSITQASAIARVTGQRTVAYIGDSTFFHSGLPALVNAVQADDQITVVVLDNFVTAMTGFQPSVTTDGQAPVGPVSNRSVPRAQVEHMDTAANGRPAAPEDESNQNAIERAARGLGVRDVYSVNPFDAEPTLAALKQAQQGHGVNVVVCHAPCVVFSRRLGRGRKGPPLAIDQELCQACSLCVRVLGCPAIIVLDGAYTIDQELCDGCALCVHVCPRDAIQPAIPERT